MAQRSKPRFLDSALRAFQLGMSVRDAYNNASQQAEMRDITDAKVQDGTALTETNAPNQDAYTYDSDTGQYVPSLKSVEAGTADGLDPVRPNFTSKPTYSLLGQNFDSPPTQGQQDRARMAAQAGVLGKFGDVSGAARLRAMAGELEGQERKLADDAELRAATRSDDKDLDAYMRTTAPRAIQTLVKQGRLDEARRFAEFAESSEGQRYAKTWLQGVRQHAVGNYTGALEHFEKLYNSQGYDDGNTVKLSPIDDGKRYRIEQFGRDGAKLGETEGDTSALANSAAMALSPANYASFLVKQQGDERVTARQLEVEQLRQQGREASEDRRDERLSMRLDANAAALEKRLAAQGERGGLTAAQERGNAEIDAARQTVGGLDPAEIRRRTAKTTETGRENPDFDPGLARAAALAARRKIGDDPAFDNRGKSDAQAAPAQQGDMDELRKRFRSDRAMNAYRLGNVTPQGVEVISQGKVIGHYR